MIFSGVGENQIYKHLLRQSMEHWPITYHQDSYLEHYKKEELVYLTADSENTLKTLDKSKAYIIGGIVDRNRYKSLTLDKANKDGIAHAKLPIQDYI